MTTQSGRALFNPRDEGAAHYVDMNKDEMEYGGDSGINISSEDVSLSTSVFISVVEGVLKRSIPVIGTAIILADGMDYACRKIWGKDLEELLDHEEPDKRGKFAYSPDSQYLKKGSAKE